MSVTDQGTHQDTDQDTDQGTAVRSRPAVHPGLDPDRDPRLQGVSTLGSARAAGKFDARRNQLAESALKTLGELGYARTSLREIAANSEFSHGVVHYYFRDKAELIVYCVRYYKARCVTRYDAVVADSTTPGGLLDAFAARLAETLRDEAPMHRLWYDLRIQSMFDETLRDAVTMIDQTLEEMIWRVITRYAELEGRPVAAASATAYGVLDGLFQQALLTFGTDEEAALGRISGQVHALMPLLLSPPGTPDPAEASHPAPPDPAEASHPAPAGAS
jgi:TetR/AcrR family transcriptional repressor of bet genes